MSDASGPGNGKPLFGSMFLGGFECAAQRLKRGRRLDVIAATGHDRRAAEDYRLLIDHGMRGARDGLRWHLIEKQPGRYDWSSFLPMLRAARESGVTVAWDLLHYGYPDDLDVFDAAFVERFAAFAGAAARLVRDETGSGATYTPVNEISFWAWCGGDTGGLNPFATRRGGALKRQLVRAFIAAAAAIRTVDPQARIACAEPLIHIFPANRTAAAARRAAAHNQFQFEALDMLLGRTAPELGGSEQAVDIVGVNYYYNNQWIDHGAPVFLGSWLHRPLHHLLGEVAARYRLPLYIAETGTEGVFRSGWLRYVADEVRAAQANGIAIGGICLYPILSHLGWDDNRLCRNGLFEGHGPTLPRRADAAMARALAVEVDAFAAQLQPPGLALAG